jgi:hypothetical protein
MASTPHSNVRKHKKKNRHECLKMNNKSDQGWKKGISFLTMSYSIAFVLFSIRYAWNPASHWEPVLNKNYIKNDQFSFLTSLQKHHYTVERLSMFHILPLKEQSSKKKVAIFCWYSESSWKMEYFLFLQHVLKRCSFRDKIQDKFVYYNENMYTNWIFKRNYLENYNDSEHAVKTKNAPFFMNFPNINRTWATFFLLDWSFKTNFRTILPHLNFFPVLVDIQWWVNQLFVVDKSNSPSWSH